MKVSYMALLSSILLLSLVDELSATTIYVPDNYSTIQSAIDHAVAGDTIIVRDGRYKGPGNKEITFHGKAITLTSQNGAASCIIDCENSGRGFYFVSGETSASVVDGFTITKGNVSSFSGWGNDGGGIYCASSNPTITNCTITANLATSPSSYGGGICCFAASPTITNCTITGNSATYYGGGIGCYYGSPTITNCTITGNSATYDGGGIYCSGSSPTITNCTITSNSVTYNGGGIYCSSSSPTITNCTITSNSVTYNGGGIYCSSSSPTITNCTITGNSAAYDGGGIYGYYSSSPTITNTILWENGPDAIYIAPDDGTPATPTLNYCDIQGGWSGAGSNNINADPLFVKGPLHNYYLSQTASGQSQDSPCVNTGSDTAMNLGLGKLSTRTDGMLDTGTVDMGYHAYVPKIVSMTGDRDNVTINWCAVPDVSYFIE